jgi:Transposase DDE domain
VVATTRLNAYLDWPAVGQVCRVVLIVREKGVERREVGYCITSAGPEWADAETLLAWNRGHWGIENRLHYVRDVTLDEDASRIRTGSAPEVMAGLRNAAITFFRRLAASNVAQAIRENAYRVADLLAKLGVMNL